MQFTINDIKEMAPGASFNRGLQYYQQGRARITQDIPERSRFIASVKGSGGNTYRVELSLDHGMLIGDCSCPIGSDCKHAVAAAMQWLQEHRAGTLPTVVASAPKKPEPSALESWLAALHAARDQADDKLIPGQHYLLYELTVVRGHVQLVLKKAYLKKDGKWSQHANYTPDYYSLRWDQPRHLLPMDSTILQLLPRVSGYAGCELSGEATALAVERL